MGSLLSRSVGIQICNNTQNILKEPRTYFDCGSSPMHLQPALSPGCSDTCYFPGSSPFWGVAGVLVYEANSFTLAVHFSNPIDRNKFSVELGLELSPGKAHLGDLEATYRRMSKGIYSSYDQDIKFARIIVSRNHGNLQVDHGPIQVTASMSYDTNSTLKLVLEEKREEKRGREEEDGGENSWDVRRDRFRRSEKETGSRETMQDSFHDLR